MENKDSWNIFTDNTEGSIMHAVQMSRLYPDSKTFVDMTLKREPEVIRQAFKELLTTKNDVDSMTLYDIRCFVEENFETDVDLEACDPTDWKENPKILNAISDKHYSDFARELNQRWKMLCRKISPEVEKNPEKYSLLYLPHPVIVPGGRFREVYYWDSYWIVIGLLHCEMFDTVKGMLLNFVHLVKEYGMIPNGGRRYYLNRSQPPLFIQMVKKYVDVSGDTDFVKQNLEYLEAEFMYWLDNHMVSFDRNGNTYKMVHYNCQSDGPRPESYFEDFELAHHSSGNNEYAKDKQEIYHELKTGAETGWDFSSRWYINPDSNDKPGELKDTRTSFMIPVDLNCFIEKNARILSEYFSICNEQEKSNKFRTIAAEIRKGVDQVLWNDEQGIWLDYNYVHSQSRSAFSLSNIVPMWTETFEPEDKILKIEKAVEYIRREGLDQYPGGLPATKVETGQQWDYPNCWPPLQHMVVDGLERSGLKEAQKLALCFADKSVRGCYLNFLDKGHMYEKYDATHPIRVGGGGEYGVQLGFGWTNGVVLDFLAMYGHTLTAPPSSASSAEN